MGPKLSQKMAIQQPRSSTISFQDLYIFVFIVFPRHENEKVKKSCNHLGLNLRLSIPLLEHQIRANNALPHILHILDDSLKVGGRVVRTRDEDVVGLSV